MENLILLIIGVPVYYAIFHLLGWKPDTTKKRIWKVVIIFFLCIPYNFNGNIYTPFGNGTAEKNFYSISSFYQNSKDGRIFCFIGTPFYQNSEKGNAICLIGIPFYQNAEKEASLGLGISIYQNAGKRTMCVVGISAYQNAGTTATCSIGIVFYQNGKEEAGTEIGVSIFQKTETKSRWFGTCSSLKEKGD